MQLLAVKEQGFTYAWNQKTQEFRFKKTRNKRWKTPSVSITTDPYGNVHIKGRQGEFQGKTFYRSAKFFNLELED